MPNARIDYGQAMSLLVGALETLTPQGVTVVHLGEQPEEAAPWLLLVGSFQAAPQRRVAGGSEPDRARVELAFTLVQGEATTEASGIYEAFSVASKVQAAVDELTAVDATHRLHLGRSTFRVSQTFDEQNRPVVTAEFLVAGELERVTGATIVLPGP